MTASSVSPTSIDYEGPGGTQEGLRYYDEAERNRHLTSMTVSILPMDTVDLSFIDAAGRDEYVTSSSRGTLRRCRARNGSIPPALRLLYLF